MEKIWIADYNMGDYTGVGFADGSEEGIAAYREVMAKVNADLWAAQTDRIKSTVDYRRDTIFFNIYFLPINFHYADLVARVVDNGAVMRKILR